MKKNNYTIDNLRFLAIILVILGHSIIIYNPYWNLVKTSANSDLLKYLCWIIYIFHMPLFVFISGFLFNCNTSLFTLLKKKFKRLIIPYILFSLFYLLPIRYILGYEGYVNNTLIYNIVDNIILGKDNGHLWFLPSLYIIFLLFYIILKKVKRLDWVLIICFVISIIGLKIPYYFGNSLQYLFWFSFGYYVANNLNTIKKISNSKFVFIIIFLLISIYVFIYGKFKFYNYICIVLRYVINLFLLPLLYFAFSKYENSTFTKVSKYSFGMYLFHSPLVYFSFYSKYVNNPFLTLFINFFVFGGLSFLLSYLVSNSKLKFIVGK